MGVIDHHQWPVAAAQTLHAAGRAFKLRQHGEDLVQRVVHTEQGANGGEHVADVEAAQQRAAQRALTLRGDQPRMNAVIVELRLGAVQVGRGVFQAVADQPRFALLTG